MAFFVSFPLIVIEIVSCILCSFLLFIIETLSASLTPSVRKIAPMNEKKKKKEEVSNGRYIPDDIAFSILSKLPLKSIMRFSCAHKSWSLPNFINMFITKSHPFYDHACAILNQFPNPNGVNCYFLSGHKLQNNVKLNFPPPFLNPQLFTIEILGSANGILCIIAGGIGIDRNTMFLNPATEEVKFTSPSRGQLLLGFGIAITFHGFGYDHVRNDYKLIQYVEGQKEPFWEIYSLKSDYWRKIHIDMPTRCSEIDAGSDLYLNGICHWLGQADDNDDIFNMVMVSFDLANEVCFVTPLPFLEGMDYGFGDVNLQVFNGSVAVMINHKNSMSFHISILGELGVKESWVRLFDVGPLSCILHPIGIWKKGNILLRKKDDELACFDLTTGMIEEIGVKAELQFCEMVIYKRSLLPFAVVDD